MNQPRPRPTINDIATQGYDAITDIQLTLKTFKQELINKNIEIQELKKKLEKKESKNE